MRKVLFLLLILFPASLLFGQPYTIQQYLSIKSAGGPSFSPDGKRLAYTTNATGTSQVWTISLPDGRPTQLTDHEDNVGFVRWLQDGSGLIFGKARGGDENTQFFFVKADGSGVRELTSDPRVRHNFGEISPDGKTIYYASNKRNRNYFDIYKMVIGSGKEEMIYQYDSNNSVAAVDASGKWLIVSRSGGELSLDNNLFLIELETGKETLLTPHKGSAQFGNVGFLPDGRSVLFAQNNDREFIGLSHMRLRSPARSSDWSDANREVRILDDTQWDVSSVALPDNAKRFAYVINREGFSELYFDEIETKGDPLQTKFLSKKSKVELPARGIVGGVTFSRDQSKIAFTFSSSKHNGDIWLYDIRSKKLSQVTQSDRAGIDPNTFVAPELIKFKTFDGREIPAWYYRPTIRQVRIESSIKATEMPLRVIVSIHGGPEGQSRPGFNPLFQYYLSRGYAVLDPNVRGSTGYGKTYTHLDDVEKREDSVKDIAAAHEWLLKQGGADPKRIAVMGGSYGGYMTMAAITLYPELWAAAVNTVGIVNWETFLQNTSGYRRRQREVEYGRLDRDIEFLRRISPITRVDKIRTPLFVIHGKNDPRVPYTEAEQLVEALKRRGVSVEYKLFDDEGHGISKLKNRLELYPLVADFLDKHMK